MLINGAIVAIGSQLGMSELAQQLVAVITSIYVISQGIADGGQQGASQAGLNLTEKLQSRKLWMTVAATGIAIMGRELGMEELTQWVLTTFFGSATIALGIADRGTQGKIGGDL